MEHSKITLNGTDWSNLYHCDYCGGAGGEQYIDLIGSQLKPLHWVPQHINPMGTVDSFGNTMITPIVGGDVQLNIAHPDWFQNHETPMHLHSIDDFRYNLKLMAIAQTMKKFSSSKKIDWENIHYIRQNINKLEVNEPLVLRSHLKIFQSPGYWTDLENSNFVEIYSFSKSHLIQSMMMIKKWTTSSEDTPWVKWRLNDATATLNREEYNNLVNGLKNGKLKKLKYEWQYDYIKLKKWDKIGDYEYFINDRFRPVFEGQTKKHYSIDAVDWVFGLNDSPFSITKQIMGVDLDSVKVAEMQKKNVELLHKHGLDLNSTMEECIAYFKAYFKQEKKNV